MLKVFNSVAIILLVIWISFFPAPIQQRYIFVTKIVLILAFAVLLFNRGIAIFKRSDLPLWIFLIAIGMNVSFAQDKIVALTTYRDLAIFMFLIYYLVIEVVSIELKFNLLAKTICICSFIVVLLAIFESLFAINPIYAYLIKNPFYEWYITGFVRPMSTQLHPAVLGSFLIGCLPFNFLFIRKEKGLFKYFIIINIILSVIVIFLTFSRQVLLGFTAMMVFYFYIMKHYRLISMLFISLFLLMFTCSYLPYPFSKFGKDILWGKSSIFSQYRFDRYVMVGRMLKEHPFAGIGFQHSRIRFNDYYPGKDIVHPALMIVDNMYLTILAETGIIGFLGFFIFMHSLLKKSWEKLKNLKPIFEEKRQLLIVLSALAGLCVNMAGYELFYWPNQYIYFCMLIGCLGGFLR